MGGRDDERNALDALFAKTMAGGEKEGMPWESLFTVHMQDDFATVSGSGSGSGSGFSNL